MIILVGSQKGGSGKSTIATNISALLATMGKDVMLVDADKQSTASNWAFDREQLKNASKVHSVQKYDSIKTTLSDLDKRYEFVIVDAAGRDSKELRTGMTIANILLVPFRPSQPDLDTLPKVVEVINDAKDFNPALRVYGLLTMGPTNPVVNEASQAKEYLESYPDITLLKTIVRDRKVYRDAISEGRGVIEMKTNKATAEIKALLEELLNGKG